MRTFILTSRVEAQPQKCDRSLYDPLNDPYEPDNLSIHQNRELVQPGDHYIHLKQGRLAGLVALGEIISEPFPGSYAVNRKLRGYFVEIKPTAQINPYTEPYKMLTRAELIRFWPMKFNGNQWGPRSSGTLLPEPEATEIWEAFLRRIKRQADPAELELSR
jgi:hypothetical protein